MASETNDPDDRGRLGPTAGAPGSAAQPSATADTLATGAPPGERATADTLATGPGGARSPGPSLDPPIASGGPRPSVELDHTIASGGPAAEQPADANAQRVIARAGRMDDVPELVTVDPQRYGVDRELARGGMGRILAARDRRLGRPVAIKELLTASPELRARFAREARITARLQHPAIVNLLEAGTWPGGEPLYVMKLVAGQSLDHVISHRPTLDARLALLPTVIAAVDALAYAHTMRIVHRDLKPANVLVGEFGETVVIDWGLAKDLADATGEPDGAAGPYRAAPIGDHTLAGAVMGPPAYMPLEQARGEPVDARADVYALGAMLYHVLAGAPPYTGTTADAILDAVIAGPPVPLASRTDGVPPDLLTIVTKAMARAAADRYPTASQLADDLKKFQTGQLVGAHHYSAWQLARRWARRHRTPLAVAAVAAGLLAALAVVSVRRIVDEQARTERSRRDAEELMSFMLLDVRDKLKPLGRLDLLDDVASKAVAYYDRRGADGTTADLHTRALARRNLGEVLAAQGHADQALAQYRAALSIAQALAAEAPTNASWQEGLSVIHENIGDVLLVQADAAGALAAYRTSMAITRALALNHPRRDAWQQDLSISHNKLGDLLLSQGDATGALVEYRAAIAIRETLAASDPTNVERQRDLSVSHDNLGDSLLAQADEGGALAEYLASLAIAKTLATNDPTNAIRQRDLSISHNKVGDVLLAQGNVAGALAEFRAATAIRATLAANDPTSAIAQRDLSISHETIGDVLLAQENNAGALAAYRASLAIASTLAANDPTNADRQRDLSVSHDKVGDARLAQGDNANALASYRASLTIAKTLATRAPTNAERQRDLSVSHDRIGDVLLAQGDAAAALVAYQAALVIDQALAADDPSNPIWQLHLAASHEKVGDAHLARRDLAGGLAAYDAALAVAQRLLNRDPNHPEVRELVETLAVKVATCRPAGAPRPR